MPQPEVTLGVSLKMYFDLQRTVEYCEAIAAIARRHEAILSGRASLFVLPTFLSIATARDIFAGTGVKYGAQDLFWDDRGAFTGEVSGADLRALGSTHVEIGHAERRAIFGETDVVIRRKFAAALRNGITPVLCIGEKERGTAVEAAASCIAQLESAIADPSGDRETDAPANSHPTPIIVAYEPVWAIGADRSASVEHVAGVGALLREWLATQPNLAGSAVIYGGSAGPGLLTELDGAVDGLFLGRFAHDPAAVERILDEVEARG